MRKTIIHWTLILSGMLLGAALVGCRQQPEPLPLTPPIPEPTPSPISVLITYQRSGGFVGYDDLLTISGDGRSELQRKLVKRAFTLQSDQIDHLHDLFQKADFFNLDDKYLAPQPVADGIQMTVAYQFGEKTHTLVTETGAVPDALQPVLVALDEIISANAK